MSKRNGNYLTPAEYQILKESFERRLIADSKLSHSFLRVGIVIKWYMNQHSGDAWPGIQTIMREARVCRRTVYNAIKYFEKMGHVVVERKRGRVNHYFPAAMIVTGAEAIAPHQSLGGSAEAIAPGSAEAIALGGVKALAPEPFTELPREPSPYGHDEGIMPMKERLKEEEGGRGSKEEAREAEIALAPSDIRTV